MKQITVNPEDDSFDLRDHGQWDISLMIEEDKLNGFVIYTGDGTKICLYTYKTNK